jgi:hypothetical protein
LSTRRFTWKAIDCWSSRANRRPSSDVCGLPRIDRHGGHRLSPHGLYLDPPALAASYVENRGGCRTPSGATTRWAPTRW